MKRVLVVDDMAVFREPIAAALRMAKFEVAVAGDGTEALRQVEAFEPDIVLLDLAMPGVDGLAALAQLRASEKHRGLPVIVLTAVTERNYIQKAGRLGVSGYLLKSQFSLSTLTERVNQVLEDGGSADAPDATDTPSDAGGGGENGNGNVVAVDNSDALEALKSIKPVITRTAINEMLETCGELKALSPTVAQLLKATQSAGASIDRIAGMIKQDQAIALQVLKMANSVVYTRGEPVESVQKAVMRIGLSQIRQLVMNIAVIEKFADTTHPRLSTEQFWEHAISTGLIAAAITRARGDGENEIDAAFTMGLLHDVGRMIFLDLIPDLYGEVMETCERLELPLEQVESRMLLVNHADLMDKTLRAWRFPKPLIDPIALHHLGIGNIRSLAPRMVTEVSTLALANRLSHALLLGSSGNQAVYPIAPFIRALKIKPETIDEICQTIPEQTADVKFAMLSQSNNSGAGWVDLRTRVSEQIGGPLRPVYVAAEPSIDAYRIVCDRIADTEDGAKPNVAIAHLTSVSDRDLVAGKLQAAESQHGVNRLPIAILSANANLTLDENTMAGREARLLPSPIDLTRFTGALRSLIGEGTAEEAA